MEEKRKVGDVSDGLRKALEEGRWPNCRRAKGIGPDGSKYHATEFHDFVSIEELPYHPLQTEIPEPDGVVWKPIVTEDRPIKLAEVSEGLRIALEEGRSSDGERHAVAVGLDGMPYNAVLRDGLVFIYENVQAGRFMSLISEPEDVVWKPLFPDQEPVQLTEVSEGLRKALQEARWPDGKRLAAGVGLDGREYHAHRGSGCVFIYEVIAGTQLNSPIAEPEGVVWTPTLRKQDWVKLREVSQGLRKAMKKGEGGVAVGVGPDGAEYRAAAWYRGLVFIDFAGVALKADGTPPLRIPLPEPEGVVWKPMTPEDRRA